jgi:hypothetical protein
MCTALGNLSISPLKTIGINYLANGVELIDYKKAQKLVEEMEALKYIICKGISSNKDIYKII